MCGRFTQTASPVAIAQQRDVVETPLFTPRYNIAALRICRNGRDSGNYVEPTEAPILNCIGQNHAASSI